MKRNADEVNNQIDEISEAFSYAKISSYIEYFDDTQIIVDGTYSLEELKQLIATIEGVAPQ